MRNHKGTFSKEFHSFFASSYNYFEKLRNETSNIPNKYIRDFETEGIMRDIAQLNNRILIKEIKDGKQ